MYWYNGIYVLLCFYYVFSFFSSQMFTVHVMQLDLSHYARHFLISHSTFCQSPNVKTLWSVDIWPFLRCSDFQRWGGKESYDQLPDDSQDSLNCRVGNANAVVLCLNWIAIGNQLYQSRDILNRNIFNVAVLGWVFCPSFVFVKVVKLLSLSQTFSCRRVFCIVMQHAHTMCTISFMVEYLSKVWRYTVTHTFFATFELFLQIEFRCFDLFWFGFIDFAFEVITVPTTYVNETRYSFRLNVTVAELQDMKNQRSGKLMSSFTPAPSPFPLLWKWTSYEGQ